MANIKPRSTSYVTFWDGLKGVGKLEHTGQPNLKNVLLVTGLTSNLISISQLRDQGIKFNFTKSKCFITNEKGEVIMKGSRSKDNCYLWSPLETECFSTCLMTSEDEAKPWHQKLGHFHLKCMKKVLSSEVVRGIPKLKIDEERICGECQIGN